MDLRQRRSFAAICESGSMNAAARRVRCAQPSLSAQVKQLESELGVELLRRQPRGVVPTAAGSHLYELAVDILGRVEHTREAMLGWAGVLSGSVAAGIIPTLSKSVLPRVLPTFAEEFPRVDLRIVEAYSGTLVEAVLAGELDFAIVIKPRHDSSLTRRKLFTDRLVVISGRASGFKPGRMVVLGKMAPLNLVIPSTRHSLRELIERLIDNGELAVARTMEIDGLYGTLQFLRNSRWSALLPLTTISDELDDPRLSVSPIRAPITTFDYYAIHQVRRPLSAAAELLIARLVAVLNVPQALPY